MFLRRVTGIYPSSSGQDVRPTWVWGHEIAMENGPAGLVWQDQPSLLLSNLSEERQWWWLIAAMTEDGTKLFGFVPQRLETY